MRNDGISSVRGEGDSVVTIRGDAGSGGRSTVSGPDDDCPEHPAPDRMRAGCSSSSLRGGIRGEQDEERPDRRRGPPSRRRPWTRR